MVTVRSKPKPLWFFFCIFLYYIDILSLRTVCFPSSQTHLIILITIYLILAFHETTCQFEILYSVVNIKRALLLLFVMIIPIY